MNNHFLKITAALFLFSGLAACGSSTPEPEEEVVRPVKIMTVDDDSNSVIRSFPAQVEANQGSYLAFRVSGEVIEFLVKPGETVKKGQLLAKLDPEDFKLRLNDRNARYELAKSQFERAQTLLEKNLAPQSAFDEAKANLLIAEAEFEKAKTDLEYTELHAPYAGSIAQVYVKNRENIQAKQNILRLLNRDRIDVSIQVPERLIARVKRDIEYHPSVIFDAMPDKSFPVDIKEWDTQADPTTLTYKVVFSLPSPETLNVLPGMTAKVQIDLSRVMDVSSSAILLPVESVFVPNDTIAGENQGFIWLYDADSQQVSLQKVTLGQMKKNGIEVIEGVKAGDNVVMAGVHYLEEGMKVRPLTKERGL